MGSWRLDVCFERRSRLIFKRELLSACDPLLTSRSRIAATAFRNIGSKAGPWPERDPDDMEPWWDAVLHDPRARRTRESTIPRDHPDASLRLDRYRSLLVLVRCQSCGVSATYALGDLRSVYGSDANITQLPAALLPCPSEHDQRDGACRPRAFTTSDVSNVRRVERPYGLLGSQNGVLVPFDPAGPFYSEEWSHFVMRKALDSGP